MIPVPTFPTDSLYKFMFIFGIFLIIASQYLNVKNIETRSESLLSDDKLISSGDSLRENAEYFYNKKNMFDDSLSIWQQYFHSHGEAFFKAHKKNIPLLFKYLNRAKAIGKLEDSLRPIDSLKQETYMHKMSRVNDYISDVITVLMNQTEEREILTDTNISMLYTGFIFMIVGGLLWYLKIQIHQDRILKQQAVGFEIRTPEPKVRVPIKKLYK